MIRIITFFLIILGLVGCASNPSYNHNSFGNLYDDSDIRNQLAIARNEINSKRQRMVDAKSELEIEILRKEIEELAQKIKNLERNLQVTEESRNIRSPSPATLSSGKYIGSRGGCYKYTKSGKKNYGAC